MGRRKKKKFIDRWWVKFLMVAAAIFLIGEAGMKIWSSEAVQTRFVYMWPYQNEILEYSSKNKIDPFLVAAVIKNESGFDTEAVSHAGAVGLMQIMPETGEWIASQMGLDHFDMEVLRRPEYNVRLGCWYLGDRIEDIPYPDTREYVKKVLRDRDKYYLYYRNKIKNY